MLNIPNTQTKNKEEKRNAIKNTVSLNITCQRNREQKDIIEKQTKKKIKIHKSKKKNSWEWGTDYWRSTRSNQK